MYHRQFNQQNNDMHAYYNHRRPIPPAQQPMMLYPNVRPHSPPNQTPFMNQSYMPMGQQPNMGMPFHQPPMNFMPPSQSFGPSPSPSPRPPLTASMLNQFQDADGQIDFNKMLSTVGQLANTVQQVTPVIRQLGSFMNQFR